MLRWWHLLTIVTERSRILLMKCAGAFFRGTGGLWSEKTAVWQWWISLDKSFKIDYTTNRKGADEQCLVSFPFLVDQKRLTVRFWETEAVILLCFYRSSREKSSSQHQMRLSQPWQAEPAGWSLPSTEHKLLSETFDIPPFAWKAPGKGTKSKKFRFPEQHCRLRGVVSTPGARSMTTCIADSTFFPAVTSIKNSIS